MATINPLPFEYLIRGAALEHLRSSAHAQAIEARDTELEDYLGRLLVHVQSLEARITALGG